MRATGLGRVQQRGVHALELGDGGGVGHGVDQDHPAGRCGPAAHRADHQAGQAGAEDPGEVEGRRVEADGVGDLVLVDHLGDERLAGRGVEGRADAEDEGQHVDVPHLDDTRHGDHAQDQRGGRHRQLRELEQAPLGEPVGDDAGVRREQQHGQELQAGGDAESRAAAVGELQHQPVLGDTLHPGTGVADDAADGVLAVVRVAQRLERGTQEGGVTPSGRARRGSARPAAGARAGRGSARPACG